MIIGVPKEIKIRYLNNVEGKVTYKPVADTFGLDF